MKALPKPKAANAPDLKMRTQTPFRAGQTLEKLSSVAPLSPGQTWKA
jgi:hypothetical protein